MYVVATAGHIDHGKSTLLQALTGRHPDRLEEERRRGMTIDLGFTSLVLPSGRSIGFVDVPGHRRLMKNMLSGIGAVDGVLFVVDATESWMPQSEEHLEIIDLLGMHRGTIALTKIDLVDAEWLAMVEDDVRERVRGTTLQNAPVVPVSSSVGTGLERLKKALDAMTDRAPPPRSVERPTMWIDRVFTIQGAGTVVTGTLQDGSIRLDDTLTIMPGATPVRVRGLQAFGRSVDEASPGGRIAVNVAGVDVDHVRRGDRLVFPDTVVPGNCFHAAIRPITSRERPMRDGDVVKMYVGTAEFVARVKLLQATSEYHFVQLETDRPAAVQWHDRVIVRDPGVQQTIGGGLVLTAPARRVRGKDLRYRLADMTDQHRVLVGARTPERLDPTALRRRMEPRVSSIVEASVQKYGWMTVQSLRRIVPFDGDAVDAAAADLERDEQLVRLRSYVVAANAWDKLTERARDVLAHYHQAHPLRSGAPKETLRSGLGVEAALFDAALNRWEADSVVVVFDAFVRLTDHQVRLTPSQRQAMQRMTEATQVTPFRPPSAATLLRDIPEGEELLNVLVDRGELVRVGRDFVFHAAQLEKARDVVVAYIKKHGAIRAADVRDVLQTTRKYAVALLEHFDDTGVTRRTGDLRVIGLSAG